MLDLEQLRREPMYQEFDACFTGHFKQSLTDLRVVLTIDDGDLDLIDGCDLTEAVSLVRGCWDEFEALSLFMASGMADFISDTYTGTHEPFELEQEFHTFIGLMLDELEYAADARYRSQRRCLNHESADEAQRVLAWITQVRVVLASKARTGANNEK